MGEASSLLLHPSKQFASTDQLLSALGSSPPPCPIPQGQKQGVYCVPRVFTCPPAGLQQLAQTAQHESTEGFPCYQKRQVVHVRCYMFSTFSTTATRTAFPLARCGSADPLCTRPYALYKAWQCSSAPHVQELRAEEARRGS